MENTLITHASIHDPTLVKEGNAYYLFGTHRQFATSHDMVNWKPLENNLTRNPEEVLGKIWHAWPEQSENPELSGNTWAPEVVWNETMGKWCMYMSVNGAHYRSVIVLLTANHLNEDWDYVGPVVYSGFSELNASKTDVPRVLGPHADLMRYHSLTDTRINAIDACVVNTDDGEMWMSFGSWFGGLWLLELDPHTGLRDYHHTYATRTDVSDAYYGIKLAGGHWNSGEGSFLIHHNDWWYLFISYGELQRTGGYQIRLFRSHDITGPYADMNGVSPISHEHEEKNWLRAQGLRLLSSYCWNNEAASQVEVAQGHNSVFRDDDGSLFLAYHTRFAGKGEKYESRIRQLFTTPDGWLVAAPCEYVGMKAQNIFSGSFTQAATTGIQAAAASGEETVPLAGVYEVIVHHNNTAFGYLNPADSASIAQAGGIERPSRVQLAGDGTLSYAPSRTDNLQQQGTTMPPDFQDTDNLELLNKAQGVFLSLPNERDHQQTLCFTGVADNLSIWAAKVE